MSRIELANGSFIACEGIGPNGHWHPAGGSAELARAAVEDFRDLQTTSALGFAAHRDILEFDKRTREQYGDDAYNSSGYYPQFAWTALEGSGILTALSALTSDSAEIKLHGFMGRAGLLLPKDEFQLAAELVAKGQTINWGHRTDECGGHNLLFLYAGNTVSKIYPTRGYNAPLLVESFIFDPSTVSI